MKKIQNEYRLNKQISNTIQYEISKAQNVDFKSKYALLQQLIQKKMTKSQAHRVQSVCTRKIHVIQIYSCHIEVLKTYEDENIYVK